MTRTARPALSLATVLVLRRSGSESLLARLELAHLDRFAIAEPNDRRGLVRPARSVDRVGNRDEHILTRIDQLDLRAIDSFSSPLRQEAEHVVAAVAVPRARFPPEQLDIGIEQLFERCEVAVLPGLQSGARLLHQLSVHDAPPPLARVCRSPISIVTFPFPCGRAIGIAPLPPLQGCVPVVDAEIAGRKPPPDGPSERSPAAPAVRVAGALTAARVVEPLKKSVRHRQAAYREP